MAPRSGSVEEIVPNRSTVRQSSIASRMTGDFRYIGWAGCPANVVPSTAEGRAAVSIGSAGTKHDGKRNNKSIFHNAPRCSRCQPMVLHRLSLRPGASALELQVNARQLCGGLAAPNFISRYQVQKPALDEGIVRLLSQIAHVRARCFLNSSSNLTKPQAPLVKSRMLAQNNFGKNR